MADNKDLRFRILASIVGGEAINKFSSDIDKTARNADRASSRMNALTGAVKTLAGAWVIKEAVQFSKGLVNLGDELDELSQKTGIAVEDLAAFKGAAEIDNIAVNELAIVYKKLSSAIVDAATGSKDTRAVFKTLGIEVADNSGKLKTSGVVLKEISDRFSKMEDGALKSSVAVKLLGKNGTDMIPVLNKGASEIERFSVAIDSSFATRAGQFNDTLAEIGISMKNELLVGIKEVLPVFQEILSAFKEAPESGVDTITLFQAIGEATRITAIGLNSFYEGFKQGVDVLVTVGRAGGAVVMDFLDTIGDSVATRARQLKALSSLDFSGASNLGDELAKRTEEKARKAAQEREALFDALADRTEKRAARIASFTEKLARNSLLLGDGSSDEISKRQKDETSPEVARNQKTAASIDELSKSRTIERDRVKEFIEQQQLENEQRRAALGDIKLTAIDLLKVTEARKLDADAIRTGKTMTEAQRAQLMLATEAIKEQRAEIIQLEFDQRRTFQTGAREYFRTYLQDATDTAKNTKQVFGVAFSSMEDSLVSFIKTGKLNFKNFADSVISEIIRITVRQAVLAPLVGAVSSAFAGAASGAASSGSSQVGSGTYSSFQNSGSYQFAEGGVMTGDGPLSLRKYANGGIAKSPQLALYGEGSQPEAFVPLPDGRTIPVTVKGGSGGMNINMTVNVEGSKESSSVESDKQTGKALGNLIKQTVVNVLVEQQRPGGLLAAR